MKYLLLISLLFFQTAQAAGIQVSPSRLDINVAGGKDTSVKIVVANPTTDVQIFEIYPDEFTQIISANPASFSLEAGSRKTVKIIINSKSAREESGTISTSLSVLGKPLADSRLQANTGIKIPLTVTVVSTTNSFDYRQYGLIASISLLAAWLVYGVVKKAKVTKQQTTAGTQTPQP